MNTHTHAPPSPFARLLSRLAPIQPAETGAVVAAFFLFFFMWSGYFSVRPVRETIGTIIGRDKLADIWIITSIVSVLIIPLYGAVVARVRRSVFLPWMYGLVAFVLVITGLALHGKEINMVAGKFFYVFISVVNLFLISVFWSFLLELFDRGQTKRLFGVIAAGGSAGALMGPFISDLAVPYIGNSGVLFFGATLFVAAIFCQRTLLNVWTVRTDVTNRAEDRPIGGNPFAGAMIILRSPYVLGIALFVVGISCVNTLLYFEQLRLVEEHFPDLENRTQIFARFDWIVQSLTVLSQIFLTGRIAQKFGVKALITFVPVIMIFAFAGLALSGAFAVLTMVVIGRRAMEYAFVRPGREMLWSPLDKETKYKAKNTVDVPVYRLSDAMSAQLNNWVMGAGFGIAAVAWLGAAVAALWAVLGYWLGRSFEDKEKLQGETSTPAGHGHQPENRRVAG
jgi:AAA family ATP:ADP antiporter